ncbi:MAG: DUF3575 domain-containing protein [Rikenellaceae bacterium]
MSQILKSTLLILLYTIQVTTAQTPQKGVVVTHDDVDWEQPSNVVERVPTFALKTNILFDALSALNVELEIPMYRHWSLCAEWIFPWWYNPSKQRCFELLSGEIQGRYWFYEHTQNYTLEGWFIGAYITGGYYDLEHKWKGVQGELWGGGLSGGYSHILWRNLRMEYALGVGVIHTKYDKYNAVWDCQSELRLLRHTKGAYNLFGITKAEVSLVWMFNRIKRE